MPEDIAESRPAGGIRSYQFLKACEGKFEIKCVAIEMAPVEKVFDESIVRVEKKDFKSVQNVHDEFKPDLILGVNTYPSYLACRLKTNAPIWADLNGWIMAEAEAQAFKMQSDAYLPHYFEFEKTILKRADKFSAVSKREEYALLGSLAWAGRLNASNFGTEMVCTIENGTEDFLSDKVLSEGEADFLNGEALSEGEAKNFSSDKALKGGAENGANSEPSESVVSKISKDKFNILWLGGYNTWVDEELLFKGVEMAMENCPELEFVSTGGAIAGLDNKTFERFLNWVNASKYKDRFKFLGWVKTSEIPLIYEACSLGLNIDRICVETITGARNRINEMMKFSLPVLTTLGSEIASKCVGACAGFGIGRIDYLGSLNNGHRGEKVVLEFRDGLIKAYELWKKDELSKMGENGRKYIIQECNFAKVCEPFLRWDGKRTAGATNLGDSGVGRFSAKIKGALNYIKQNGARKFLRKVVGKVVR